MTSFVLVSHSLCPYVQRAAIVLEERHVPYERRYVDLANKPSWFNKISPLGKTPVLLVGDTPIFESAVICEYLEDELGRRLHPQDPLQRAVQRAWVEFGTVLLNAIGSFYNARDEDELRSIAADIQARFLRVEAELGPGPYFVGSCFSMVDAAFAPVFRYFDVLEPLMEMDFFVGLPRVQSWRRILGRRASVQSVVAADFSRQLIKFFASRPSVVGHRASLQLASAPDPNGSSL